MVNWMAICIVVVILGVSFYLTDRKMDRIEARVQRELLLKKRLKTKRK